MYEHYIDVYDWNTNIVILRFPTHIGIDGKHIIIYVIIRQIWLYECDCWSFYFYFLTFDVLIGTYNIFVLGHVIFFFQN